MRSAGTVEAVGFRVVAGDAGPQRPQAQRLGVAEMAVGDRGPGGFQHRFRRPRPRLADLHVDDALARMLAVGGRAHDVHDDEGLDIAAARGMRPEAHRARPPVLGQCLAPAQFTGHALASTERHVDPPAGAS